MLDSTREYIDKGKEIGITNAFYESLGFEELEYFPTLWDEWNPCQVYVKYIGDLAKMGK